MDSREKDKKVQILPPKGSTLTKAKEGVTLDQIKSLYIASGLTPLEIAEQTFIPISQIETYIEEHKLDDLRKAYIIEGVAKLQNIQLQQSHKLMDLETSFKKMRIIQLQQELESYMAYHARHGDFLKRHPLTGEVLRNTDGIPIQIRLPNVSKELAQLKEAVTMSEGVRSLLHRLDEIINTGRKEEVVTEDLIDLDDPKYLELFKSSEEV
jgi:DNA-binding CsgD family transcriptional regulator